MIPLHAAWLIQIEVTNACFLKCAHCTRAVSHVRKPYCASVESIENALRSLDGWPRGVGCMGGEPTLHPDFEQICQLYQKYFPRERCGLWTSGGKGFHKHERIIRDTFGIMLYNDHSEVGKHQPLFIASGEVIPDDDLRNELIDNCWLQQKWSPTINPKGAFFCEVAGTIDLMFDGPGGYPLEPQWWNKEVTQFADQRNRYCHQCSIPVPFGCIPNDLPFDYVSPGNLEKLKAAGSPLIKKGGYKIIEQTFTREQIEDFKTLSPDPANYLGPNQIRKKGADVHEFMKFLIGGSIEECLNKDVEKCEP
jgi:hypothetical protein